MANSPMPSDMQVSSARDQLRISLKSCDINITCWEAVAVDTRSKWRQLWYGAVEKYENRRIDVLKSRQVVQQERLVLLYKHQYYQLNHTYL